VPAVAGAKESEMANSASRDAVAPDQLALQRLYHWERTAPTKVILTQPQGGGGVRSQW